MKEIKSILQFFKDGQSTGEQCALAQVVRVEGSSYRREGARMIVFESGIFEGGISGGCLEGDALKRSQLAILKQEPSIITYDTSKEMEIGIGLGCNGIIDVLLTPVTTDSENIKTLEKCISQRRTHIIVTITASNLKDEALKLGQSFYYDTDQKRLEGMATSEIKNFVLEKIGHVLELNKSKSYAYNEKENLLDFHIELIPAQYHLAIYGDNYDVYPLIQFAGLLDWEISLVGNIQKLKKQHLTPVKNIYPKHLPERPKIDKRTAVILMAHDFKTDIENLKSILISAAPYIASLGPKKRFEKIKNKFEEEGKPLSEQNLFRIHAPCGLEIGADSPEEIALSICSEIMSSFTGKEGGMLRKKMHPIHDRF
jgi:xanthine/CO dehydrogenase XdhC/CoxF family maturation factor